VLWSFLISYSSKLGKLNLPWVDDSVCRDIPIEKGKSFYGTSVATVSSNSLPNTIPWTNEKVEIVARLVQPHFSVTRNCSQDSLITSTDLKISSVQGIPKNQFIWVKEGIFFPLPRTRCISSMVISSRWGILPSSSAWQCFQPSSPEVGPDRPLAVVSRFCTPEMYWGRRR